MLLKCSTYLISTEGMWVMLEPVGQAFSSLFYSVLATLYMILKRHWQQWKSDQVVWWSWKTLWMVRGKTKLLLFWSAVKRAWLAWGEPESGRLPLTWFSMVITHSFSFWSSSLGEIAVLIPQKSSDAHSVVLWETKCGTDYLLFT